MKSNSFDVEGKKIVCQGHVTECIDYRFASLLGSTQPKISMSNAFLISTSHQLQNFATTSAQTRLSTNYLV